MNTWKKPWSKFDETERSRTFLHEIFAKRLFRDFEVRTFRDFAKILYFESL